MKLAMQMAMVFIALVLIVSNAPAQPLIKGLLRVGDSKLVKSLDRNRDRVLTQAEAHVPKEIFAEADLNKDGVIGLAEFNGLFSRFTGYCIFRFRAGPNCTLPLAEAERLCLPLAPKVKDTDNDGVITWSEWWKSNTRAKRVWGFRITAVPKLWLYYQPFDLDGDGRITKSEAASTNLELKYADANNDGIFTVREATKLYRSTLASGMYWRWIMMWDINFDGVISLEEWQGEKANRELYDANQDGEINILDVYCAPQGPVGVKGNTSSFLTTQATPSAERTPTTTLAAKSPTPPYKDKKAKKRRDRGFLLFFSIALSSLFAYGLYKRKAVESKSPAQAARQQAAKSNLRMAKTYMRRNRFEKAASFLQSLVCNDGDIAVEARVMLVEAFLKSGNKEAAFSQMELLALHQAPMAEIYRLALTFEKLKEPERARDLLNSIYARNVKYKDVSVRLKRLSQAKTTRPGKLSPGESGEVVIPKRYSNLEIVGSGGMGQVYRADDELLQRKVALKALLPALATKDNICKRFAREARAMARLNHPSILPIFDVSPHGHYFTMPLIEGTELDEYADLEPHFGERLHIAIETTSALCHAHEEGILHRDIKPANILISTEGVPYLMDFGLAKLDDAQALTATDEQLGTLFFMAPELLEGASSDKQSDIYSLGLSLYQLFTGRSLFTESDGLAARLLEVSHTPPSKLNDSLPKKLDEIILKCVQRNREKRYVSCQELLDDLLKLKKSQGGLDRDEKATLLLASRAEEIYRQYLHRLKNLLAICCRYSDDDEKLVKRFYSAKTMTKLKELTDEMLLEELDTLNSLIKNKSLGGVAQAINELHKVSPQLRNLCQNFSNMQDKPTAQRARAINLAHETLSPKIKGLAVALEKMELSIYEVAKDAAASAPTVAVSIESKIGATIRTVDPEKAKTLLGEVLENLYQNAAHANAKNVTVSISLSANESHSIITVTNDGDPIDNETAELLFKKSVTTKTDGSGTGLIACAERLHDLNGTISLEETNPVSFQLTLWRGRAGTSERKPSSAQGAHRRR